MFLQYKIIDIQELRHQKTPDVLSRMALYSGEAFDIVRSVPLSSIGKDLLETIIPQTSKGLREQTTQQRWAEFEPLLTGLIKKYSVQRSPQAAMFIFRLLFDIELYRTRLAEGRPTVKSPWNPNARFPDARTIIRALSEHVVKNDANCGRWKKWIKNEESHLAGTERVSLKSCDIVDRHDGTFQKLTGSWTIGMNGEKQRTKTAVILPEEALIRAYTHQIENMSADGQRTKKMIDIGFVILSILQDEKPLRLSHTPLADVTDDILEELEPRIVPYLRKAKEKASDIDDLLEEYRSKELTPEEKKTVISTLKQLLMNLQSREQELWQMTGNVMRIRTIVTNDRLRAIAALVAYPAQLTSERIDRAGEICTSILSAYTCDTPASLDLHTAFEHVPEKVNRILSLLNDIRTYRTLRTGYDTNLAEKRSDLSGQYKEQVVPMLQALAKNCDETRYHEQKIKRNILAMLDTPFPEKMNSHVLYLFSILRHMEQYGPVARRDIFEPAEAFLSEWTDILMDFKATGVQRNELNNAMDRQSKDIQDIIQQTLLPVPRKLYVHSTRKGKGRAPQAD